MTNLEEQIKSGISRGFTALFNHELPETEIQLQPTRKEFEGNFTFVTFPYSRISKLKPEETAEKLGEYLQENVDGVESFNVVKGFLNILLKDELWLQQLYHSFLNQEYGTFPKKDHVVLVEYSSPNTNKPLHLGHLRNIFLGDSVSNILTMNGYDVNRVQIINDRGIHICKSMLAYQRFGEGETPESSGIKGDHLIGKYYVRFEKEYQKQIRGLVDGGMDSEEAKKRAELILEAQQMLKDWESGKPEVVELWKTMNGWVYEGFEETYRNMRVEFDKYYYESDTYLLGKELVEEGLENGSFFKKEDGSVWVDLTDQNLDQKLLLRSDGTAVYMTQDMGTAELRYDDFHFWKSIYVVGNEQDYHFDVLFKILKKLGRPYADEMNHLSYGMVDLPEGKMKSREGTVVDADDLMQEMVDTAQKQTDELGKIEGFSEEQAMELYDILGLGALKYFLLKVDPKKRMLFNPKESVDFHGNTGPFIQYTHARISAILRKAAQIGVDFQKSPGEIHLEKTERALLQQLYDFPAKVKAAGEEMAPYIIAQYTYELAKEYNRFYAELPIFNAEQEELVQFRVGLSAAVAGVIKKGMKLLGIDVPERM